MHGVRVRQADGSVPGSVAIRGRKTIVVDVRNGNREAALLHAMASNQSHGLKRTNADKRRAVSETLKIVPGWTDGKIGAFYSRAL